MFSDVCSAFCAENKLCESDIEEIEFAIFFPVYIKPTHPPSVVFALNHQGFAIIVFVEFYALRYNKGGAGSLRDFTVSKALREAQRGI